MVDTYRFTLPCYVSIGKRKVRRVSLTLNWYRNAHYQVSNAVKQAYSPIYDRAFSASNFTIDYRLTLADNRRTDAMNWIAVADKFFADWLSERGMIPDDNARHYLGGRWSVDKDTVLSEHRLVAIVTVIE